MMEGRTTNCLTFVKRKIASKIFGKIILKPLQFQKDSSSPRMTEEMQIYSTTWNVFRQISTTLNSLKSVFNVFRRKLSLGAPRLWHSFNTF